MGWRRDVICVWGGFSMGGLRCRCGFCSSGLFVEVVGNGVVEGGDIVPEVCNAVGIG